MRGRKIPIPLPNTGAMARRKNAFFIRAALVIFLVLFAFLQMQFINNTNYRDQGSIEANDSTAAILSMVPPVFHKYLTTKPRNNTGNSETNSSHGVAGDMNHMLNITEMRQQIYKYNEAQTILNEDSFGPLQNDSLVIVVQVHKRITYLRHLIVSLAQARDISRALLIFSHDFYDDDINELVQSVDFCKVMQIFYPHSIQTHPNEFPGADPEDCPRNIKRDQAVKINCKNAQSPDSYGHYREAGFTQTKHHWWWKANRVFDQLNVTRYHSGLVLFLEEDHYVAEDFIYLLDLMQRKSNELCPKCNILSLGTYLKTFNYYTYNNKKNNKKAFFGQSYAASASNMMGLNYYGNHKKNSNSNNNYNNKNSNDLASQNKNNNEEKYNSNGNNNHDTTDKYSSNQAWGYQVLPSLYSIYQKKHNFWEILKLSGTPLIAMLPGMRHQLVEVTPWISSKHNMGMALNRTTFHKISKCAEYFCSYDDYNWDWSLQHVSQQCLENKLYAMVVKGPRVFHIGECGVHHKKNNCESNQVISKVQQVIRIATRSGQLYPKSLSLTMASVIKKTKLRKGNGGWGDKRDHHLCLDMVTSVY